MDSFNNEVLRVSDEVLGEFNKVQMSHITLNGRINVAIEKRLVCMIKGQRGERGQTECTVN